MKLNENFLFIKRQKWSLQCISFVYWRFRQRVSFWCLQEWPILAQSPSHGIRETFFQLCLFYAYTRECRLQLLGKRLWWVRRHLGQHQDGITTCNITSHCSISRCRLISCASHHRYISGRYLIATFLKFKTIILSSNVYVRFISDFVGFELQSARARLLTCMLPTIQRGWTWRGIGAKCLSAHYKPELCLHC